jgi:hypothetical protein
VADHDAVIAMQLEADLLAHGERQHRMLAHMQELVRGT